MIIKVMLSFLAITISLLKNLLLSTGKRKITFIGNFITCSIKKDIEQEEVDNYDYKEEPDLVLAIWNVPEPALNV